MRAPTTASRLLPRSISRAAIAPSAARDCFHARVRVGAADQGGRSASISSGLPTPATQGFVECPVVCPGSRPEAPPLFFAGLPPTRVEYSHRRTRNASMRELYDKQRRCWASSDPSRPGRAIAPDRIERWLRGGVRSGLSARRHVRFGAASPRRCEASGRTCRSRQRGIDAARSGSGRHSRPVGACSPGRIG